MAPRILIIENEMNELQKMATHLRQYKVEVFVATTSEQGLEIFFAEYPDLVFVNMLMPVMSGPDIVKKMKSRIEGTRTPIYFLSSLVSSGSGITKETGADGQIERPVQLKAFDQIVRQRITNITHTDAVTKERKPLRKPVSDKWRNTTTGETPVPKVFAQVFKQKATGMLTMQGAKGAVRIKFAEGQPTAVSPAPFAKFLIRKGYLEAKKTKELLLIAKESELNFSETAVREGLLGSAELEKYFEEFLRHMIDGFVVNHQTQVVFKEHRVYGTPVIHTLDLVYWGVQRNYNFSRLKRIFDKEDRYNKKLYPAISPKAMETVSRPLRSVYDKTRGGWSGQSLLDGSDTLPEKQLLQIVYSLLLGSAVTYDQSEAVKTSQKPATKADGPMPIPDSPVADSVGGIRKVQPGGFAAIASARKTGKDSPESEQPPPIIPDEPQSAPETVPETPVPVFTETKQPTNRELFDLSAMLLEKKSFSKAQAGFEELIARGQEKPEILVNLGVAIYNNRFNTNPHARLLDVAWVIKQALELDDKYTPAYLTLGKILEKEGKPQLAMDQYQCAVSIDPQNAKAMAALKRLSR